MIWNGFEAHASEINVIVDGQEMVDPPVLFIEDNGIGIDHRTIKQTFGTFLSSEKRGLSLHIKSQMNKGKGRFRIWRYQVKRNG